MVAMNGKKPKLTAQLWSFLKFLTVLCLTWMLGLFGLSIAWVCVISVFVYIWMFESHRFDLLHPLTSLQNIRTHDGDVDQTVWLSKVFCKLWPCAKVKVEQFMRNQLQSSIRQNLPSALKSFTFTSIHLGEQVPKVLGVDVKESEKAYVILDLEILYSSDADVGLSIGKLESSICDIQVHGTLRVVLTDLNCAWPFFGKMNLSFVTPPSLSFKLAKAAGILDVVGFRDIVHECIVDQLTALLVLPHFLTIPIHDNDQGSTSYPFPKVLSDFYKGVLRLQVNRAKDLPLLNEKEYIEPYCVIQLGASRYKTGVIQKTNHPMWNEVYEFVVNDTEQQYIDIQVLDANDTSGFGALGSCYLSVGDLVEASGKTVWLPLDRNATCAISVTSTWLDVSDDVKLLQDSEYVTSEWTSTALLVVGVASASDLPKVPRSLGKPSPLIKLKLNQQEMQTSVVQNSNCPSWGENYYFLCNNPAKEELVCEIIDAITGSFLGQVTVSVTRLLESSNTMDSTYEIDGCDGATLKLNLCLKVLVSVNTPVAKTTKSLSDGVRRQSSSPMLTKQSFPLQVSTPVKTVRSRPVIKIDNDSSSGHSDLPDFDTWSETESNAIAGGATYMVISRPDGSTVSEIVQNADESTIAIRDDVSIDESKYGRVQVTLRYSSTHQKLMIVVHQCCNLTPVRGDKDGLPDPFVMLTLYNQKNKIDRKKTKTQKSNTNPIFDETFEFKLPKPTIEHAMVELRVKNKKGLLKKRKSTIGAVLLRLQALDLSEARTDWFLIRNVKDSMESLNGTNPSISSHS